jgi:hypothetical protein
MSDDEYGKGPVSRPAGIVAKAAGALAVIPQLRPFAMATQIAASAVSAVATMFGYSRPVTLSDVQPYRPTYLGNVANTNATDSATKLSLDCKQELSVDPRTVGLDGSDQMDIKSIAARESYFHTFPWQVVDATEDLLFETAVHPMMFDTNSAEVHMTACCYAAVPFRYWRGRMKFRFQIVASAFHKGRLKVVYEPRFVASNEYNTNYTEVIDLAHQRDFTVEIGWGNEHAALRTVNPVSSAPLYADGTLGITSGATYNGILSVYVVNELTVPNSVANNDIEINCFASLCDAEFFDPSGEYLDDISMFEPQMGESPDGTNTDEEDVPMQEEPTSTMAPMPEHEMYLKVFGGEPVTSLRQLLKRYTYLGCYPKESSSREYWYVQAPNFPFYRGYAPNAIHEAATPVDPTPYTYCHTTLLNYFAPAFTGWKGAIRYKYLREGGNSGETDPISIVRRSTLGTYFVGSTNTLDTTTTVSARAAQNKAWLVGTWPGSQHTTSTGNPCLEAEMPFYSNLRFYPAKKSDYTGDSSFNKTHFVLTKWDSLSSQTPMVHSHVATGEDFSLFFFTGMPRVWLQSDPTAS